MPVTSFHPLYENMLPDWEDCRLFYKGEKAVKEQGSRYIPRPEGSTKTEYNNYVRRAFFFPAIERTVSGLMGAIDRKDPTIDVPSRISYIVDDADFNGATLRQFSRRTLDETLAIGRCGIMVDRAEDGSQGYLVLYQAEDIINWAEDKEQNLLFVVLREWYYSTNAGDPYKQVKKLRYRVLRLEEGRYIQDIYETRINGTNGTVSITPQETIEPSKAGTPLTYIPFVFCNIKSITADPDKPPLLDLVRKNIEHLRVSADYANSLYFTANPILWASGVTKPPVAGGRRELNEPQFKLSIGSSRAVLLPTDGKIGLLECSGNGVKPNKERADDIKHEMAVLGARLLENQRTGVEAAETAQIRQSGETAVLSGIVVNVGEAIRKSLEMLNHWEGGADWMTSKTSEVDFALNNDFIEITLNPQLFATLIDAVTKELISFDTFIYNCAVGEILPPGRTADEERELIENQPIMGSAAKAMEAYVNMQNAQPISGQGKEEEQQTEE